MKWLANLGLVALTAYAFRDSILALCAGAAIGYIVCYDAMHELRAEMRAELGGDDD